MSAAIWTALSLLLLAAPAMAEACRKLDHDGNRYTVCEIDPSTEDVRLFLGGADGKPLGSFARVAESLAPGEALALAMNAGMYHPDRRPVGLYIENGREIAPLVTSAGPGNFGMLPNGVLCIGDGTASVIETRRFSEERPACAFATQSGPMLVIDGQLHPRFLPRSTSRYLRNGAGVTPEGHLVLAISDRPVTFHAFARLFRDALRTPNALYLDGKISRLYAPEAGRADIGLPMGPILGVVRR